MEKVLKVGIVLLCIGGLLTTVGCGKSNDNKTSSTINVCELTFIDTDSDSCEAMDVELEGVCNCGRFYYWDGTQCVSETPCTCSGDDCQYLFKTMEECQDVYGQCD